MPGYFLSNASLRCQNRGGCKGTELVGEICQNERGCKKEPYQDRRANGELTAGKGTKLSRAESVNPGLLPKGREKPITWNKKCRKGDG